MTERVQPALPGATLGVVGGGQLGRMLAMEARRMGYRVSVLDPNPDSPAGQFADERIVADYSDVEAARSLAQKAAAVTYEFENVDAAAIAAAEEAGTVRPRSSVLRVTQHRLREKTRVSEAGFPVADFAPVDERSDLDAAMERIGLPAVLKTATLGYDGKGQAVLERSEQADEAFAALRPRSEALVLERLVPFSKEISAIAARDARGKTVCFPPAENIHRDGILDVSIAPARVGEDVAQEARRIAAGVADALDVTGLIAVEMFVEETAEGPRLLVNELAPRPHNSGHYTLDACATSQFEQLARMMCGLPHGDPTLLGPAVMVNLLGEVWTETSGHPRFDRAMSVPGARLHLYGKAEARPGRKMGHITVVGAGDAETALERALEARRLACGS